MTVRVTEMIRRVCRSHGKLAALISLSFVGNDTKNNERKAWQKWRGGERRGR